MNRELIMRILALVFVAFGIRLWIAPLSRVRFPVQIPAALLRLKAKDKFQHSDFLSLVTAIRQELVAGIPVNQALAHALSDQPDTHFKNCRRALDDGSDLIGAFKLDATALEDSQVHQLVKILQINRAYGASIISALDMLVRAALTKQEMNYQIAAELSGAKATITVLALLPVVGIFLGALMGTNVIYWLATNRVGWACLMLAAILETCGICWVRRLMRNVTANADQ